MSVIAVSCRLSTKLEVGCIVKNIASRVEKLSDMGKRHHILPEAFQLLFSSDGKKKVWSVVRGKVFETNALNSAVVGRHYDYVENGEKKTWIEDRLSILEGQFLPIVQKIIFSRSLKKLKQGECENITEFHRLCMMRFFEFNLVPDPKKEDESLEMLREAIHARAAALGRMPSEKTLSAENLTEISNAAKKQAILDSTPNDADQVMVGMKLSLVEASDEVQFITGEHPSAYFSSGTGDLAVMPICPSLALRWSRRNSSPLQRLKKCQIMRVNRQIFDMSTYSIASRKDDLSMLMQKGED